MTKKEQETYQHVRILAEWQWTRAVFYALAQQQLQRCRCMGISSGNTFASNQSLQGLHIVSTKINRYEVHI
jgi:hypothetical protein